ncbi:hypothetical protein [Paraburkholderia atlantica]|uniref:hypothetical protein n=1 Tax=Paraburkholderia atlantica TaxID=2654982 RepID=UPI00160C6BCE|nr:hypothetical protein [Paraburkholderia atlantica]MBB5414056.1 hypothetical protein [Paraburkholderia atlantica]
MGKFANALAWREYEAKRDRELDEHLDDEPPLTEAERAAQWDDKHWEKVDAYPRTDRQWGTW